MQLLKRLAKPRKHEKMVRALFGDDCLYKGSEPQFPFPLYLLAFSNRSGSNLLASYLRRTGLFSGFHEQLRHGSVKQLASDLGAKSFPDFFQKIMARDRNDAIYGFKASWDQILLLLRCRIHLMYRGIRVIHIVRKDVIGQSVSFSIAHQTQRWSSRQTGKPNVVPEFKFENIEKKIDGFFASENAVALLCTLFDLPRLEVTYEALTEHPRETMLRIGEFSGVDLSSWQPPERTISKQADQLNANFVSQFVERAKSDLLAKPSRPDKRAK